MVNIRHGALVIIDELCFALRYIIFSVIRNYKFEWMRFVSQDIRSYFGTGMCYKAVSCAIAG